MNLHPSGDNSIREHAVEAFEQIFLLKQTVRKAFADHHCGNPSEHLADQNCTSELQDEYHNINLKTHSELSLQNEVLQAEIKALKTKDEANIAQIRHLERLTEQQSQKIKELATDVNTSESQRSESSVETRRKLEDLQKALQTIQSERDALRCIVAKVHESHSKYSDDSYIARDDYERCVDALKDHHHRLESLQRQCDQQQSDLLEQTRSNASLQHHALELQHQKNMIADQLSAREKEVTALKLSLECHRQEVTRLQSHARDLTSSLKSVELAAQDAHDQLALTKKLYTQATQRCDEQERELLALLKSRDQAQSFQVVPYAMIQPPHLPSNAEISSSHVEPSDREFDTPEASGRSEDLSASKRR